MGDEPSLEERADGNEPVAQNVHNMFEYLERQVERAKAMGVEFSDVENMLAGARIILESGDFEDAIKIISECMQKASKRFSEYEMLYISLRKMEREIQAAHNSGKDVSEAAKFLKISRQHMANGDYRLGIESIRQSLDVLKNIKPAEIAWGSGLIATDDSQ